MLASTTLCVYVLGARAVSPATAGAGGGLSEHFWQADQPVRTCVPEGDDPNWHLCHRRYEQYRPRAENPVVLRKWTSPRYGE